ncbi:putative PHO84-inorganic phosphate permease [Ceraceosorus guamensis]|uniref:Putative PHO84-inorganic phosphate permease n=1 Tax=Ceraceosorus guamensis TaxID=1522189 RepID=A0A316VYD8_9BASI|nr:putative PHO84-inorganic phosphate permease [Ceraceosorus guamensis]PWN41311.1 putative PHO84-inorganic phosphate permease [Ceraceosorus guamensis]
MAFGNDLDAYQGASTSLALVEKSRARSFLGLSWGEAKLLVIAGVGFFMDAYDLFIINMIYAILLRTYKEFKVPQTDRGAPLPNITWGLDGGVLKASANIGNVFGQILFGFLGDTFGRSAVYGKELIIIIVAVIMIISVPDYLGGVGVTAWMTAFRFIMGIGIGGDYPMSATIVSDRSHAHKRGTLLALIFSNQGWGNLVGAIAAVVVIAAYKGPVTAGDTHKLSGAWRILQGLALIPAFGVLYFRLTLVESTRFTQARQIQDDPELLAKASAAGVVVGESDSDEELAKKGGDTPIAAENEAVGLKFATVGKKPHNEFFEYFSEWRHLRVLLGTILGWFLVDITFYGINLNQSVILQAIGFTTGSTWSKLMKVATGNLIITVAGFLPGYFFTAALIEVVGRKPIQLLGFAMNALFFGILGGKFDEYKAHTNQIFPLFVFLQFFFNFGANATTFIIPAEAFPTRVRASAHGLSAACGKLGAILASLGFSVLADPKKSIGQEKVFWIFFAISILGFIVTILLVPETKGYDADEVDRKELAEKRGLGAETNPNLHSL